MNSSLGLLGAAEEADAILHRARWCRASSSPSRHSSFDIHQKLRELYDEFSADARQTQLKLTSYLLDKLLARIELNLLIVNLYPGNKGYSIALRVNGDVQPCESAPVWPYEQEDLLAYIDNEELPVLLLDILETEHSCLFYSGCIVAQVRDFRQTYPACVCDTHHVLLRPSAQSIISDVNSIVRSGCFGKEERLFLESALVLATAPPLCLEPEPAIGLLSARLHHQRHLLSTPDIRKRARKYSQVAVNRKRRLDQLARHTVLDVISKQRFKHKSGRATSKFPKRPSEVLHPVLAPKLFHPHLTVPSDVHNTVSLLARPYERPRNSSDCSPLLMEEYILETERAPATPGLSSGPGVFHIKLSILQRPSNQEFLGELYVDRDHVEGERNGSSCRFLLGTRAHANRYIQQFTEIFTEEGRKSVRIKHIIPGQVPKVSFTAAMRELNHAAHLARAQAAASAAASPTPSVQSGAATPAVGGGVVSQHGLVSAVKVPPPSPAVPSPTGVVAAPTPSPEVVLVTGPSPNARRTISASLPLLQAQLQAGPQGQAQSPSQVQQQQLNSIHHIQLGMKQQQQQNEQLQSVQINSSPQSIQNTQQTANQLLAQQLTNPQQPLNPHKLQPAIIHIQHPLSGQILQQKVNNQQQQLQQGMQSLGSPQPQPSPVSQLKQVQPQTPKQRTTNPAISALVTSLMNSAHQFQQQAAAASAAAKSTASGGGNVSNNSGSNATILNLLNSAPAAMTNSPAGATVLDPGQTKKTQPPSALLERLMAPPAPAAAQPQQSIQLPQLQNVQVQIPGLSQPISLSLNVSAAGGASTGLLVSVPVSQPTPPTGPVSLPITHLMSGVKAGTPLQIVPRPRVAPRQVPAKVPNASVQPGHVQYIGQQTATASIAQQQRRRSNPNEPNK